MIMLMSTVAYNYHQASQMPTVALFANDNLQSNIVGRTMPQYTRVADYDDDEDNQGIETLFARSSASSNSYLFSNLSLEAGNPGDIQVFVNWSDNTVNMTVGPQVDRGALYRLIIPMMLLFCLLSVIINVVIVASVRWLRRRPSPTLCLSVSLALADAFVSLTVGSGLIVNSLMPVGYDMHLSSNCFPTTLEVFRLAGVVISALHLLLLAVNHYIGILRPLHYASIMTQHNTLLAIALMWTLPIAFFSIYFVSVPGQGFMSYQCRIYTFTLQRPFRVVVSTLFFMPLAVMTFIYVHIFIIVKQHQRGRIQLQGTTQQQLRRNVKATVTTLLILGTYVLGWLPAVLFFIIVCMDCVLVFEDIETKTMIGVSIAFNTLLILKALIDPVVYAARMADIRAALHRMAHRCFKCCNWKCLRLESATPSTSYSSIRSRNDTVATSLRLHSLHGNSKRTCNSPVLVYQQRVKNGNQQCTMRHGTAEEIKGGVQIAAIVVVVEDTDLAKDNQSVATGQQNGTVTSC